MYVKLTHTGNVLKVAIWVSGTPDKFLLHILTVIHAYKQIGLGANFASAKKALKTANRDMGFTKMEYTHLIRSKKKKSKGEKEMGSNLNQDPEAVLSALAVAKAAQKKASKDVEALKLCVT